MKKILLVEDDILLNKTLTYNLISEGYDTESVLNASAAAEVLAGTEYDLVLLDINLPDGSGYDLCRLIKPENPDTLLSKSVTEEEWREFRQGIRNQTDKLEFLFQVLVKESVRQFDWILKAFMETIP